MNLNLNLYTVQRIGTLPGDKSSQPNAINEAGTVVGFSSPTSDPSGTRRAFSWEGGKFNDLHALIQGILGAQYSDAQAINLAGDVVGVWSPDPQGRWDPHQGLSRHGFLYRKGQIYGSRAKKGKAVARNAARLSLLVAMALCFSLTFPTLHRGVSRAMADGFTFTIVDAPGVTQLGADTHASGVNGAGQIVGAFSDNCGFVDDTGYCIVDDVTGLLTGQCMGLWCFAGPTPDCQGSPNPPLVDAYCGPTVDNTLCIVCDSGPYHGFLRASDSSGFTTLDVPGAYVTYARGINDAGQIVGRFEVWSGHGFRRDTDNSFTTIDAPGAAWTEAFGINATGQIVGWFQDANGLHGFLRTADGGFTGLDAPGAIETEAFGINTAGQIVGYFRDNSNTYHGFLRGADGSFTTVDAPGAAGTWVSGVNGTGQIVGYFSDGSNSYHGFLLAGGAFTTIEPNSALSSWASGINDAGQIVGRFIDASNVGHGFLASPPVAGTGGGGSVDTTPPMVTITAPTSGSTVEKREP